MDVAPQLTFRPARPDESDLLADLVLGDAEQESTRVAMRQYALTDLETVRKLVRVAWRGGGNWRTSVLALHEGEVVGVLQTGHSSFGVSRELIITVLRTLGVRRALGLPGRMRLRAAVSPARRPGSFYVSELHVAPGMRGRGFGHEMLVEAERMARQAGYRSMALHTYTTNPAQRLYTRFGFVIIERRTSEAFERLTGAAGQVLMVKELESSV